MTKRILAFFSLIIFLFSSCQKTELSPDQSATNVVSADKTTGVTALNKGVVSDAHWFGDYDSFYDQYGNPLPGGDPDQPHISDSEIISGGVAVMPSLASSGYSSYSSYMEFDIPAQYNISGDSMISEVIVKNQRGYSVSDYDVIITISGSQGSVEVHFVADAAYQSSASYSLGTLSYANLPQLVHYFGDFETVKLTTKKGQTAVYINNKLLYNFKYSTTGNKIGRINSIIIAGVGIPVVDNVKLTNSYTNKKLMLEDFNTAGQSHTIFY